MTRPNPDKAEIALEYPNKFYIGTFERTARFGAHLDKAGVSLTLERTGDAAEKKAVRMHFHHALFAEILQELAKTASAMPEHTMRTTARRCETAQRHSMYRSRANIPRQINGAVG